MRCIRVASRKSALALTQTKWVIDQLQSLDSQYTYEIVPIVTKGDRITDVALAKVGGKGLFVTEIEEAMLDHRADIAVHSMKDVPAQLAHGLMLGGIPQREDARDALISKHGETLSTLPAGAVVGTSSLRRLAQLHAKRPDLQIVALRGNIDTRLKKLADGDMDAILLAAAGLHRMGWADKITEYLSPDDVLPAVGQGVLGIECREDDKEVRELLAQFTDAPTQRAAQAERTVLLQLNGSCQVPIAAYATLRSNHEICLQALVATTNGGQVLRVTCEGTDPHAVGEEAARMLRDQGADAILQAAADTQ
jgi:hydroxymethylbilane synthase